MSRPKPKAKPKAPTLPVVTGKLIERVAGDHGPPCVEVTPAGLSLVEGVARQGGSQSLCASSLGISLTTFKRIINESDGENPVRLAFEKGRSLLDFEVATILLNQARNGQVIAAIFYGKSQLGWTDQPQVNNQTAIQIVLPDSMDRESFAKRVEARTVIALPAKPDEAAP